MKEGWEEKKLGEVCKISTGKSNTVDAVTDGKYAFFDRSKKVKKSAKYLFDCDAIIVAGEGQTFLPKFYSGKFDLHQRAYAIYEFDEGIDIKFIFKYLIHCHKYFERVAVGATAKSLRLRHFQNLPIPIPPLPEQKQIVAKLDEAFAAIDLAKANIEKNIENARELFQSRLNEIFSRKGEGWEEKRLGDVCKLKSGDSLTQKDMHLEGKIPVFGGNGISGTHNEHNLEGKNIIIGRVGALCGNVRYVDEPIWVTDNAFFISEFKHEFDYNFLTYLLNYVDLRKYARQTAQPVISNSSIKNVLLVFPESLSEQKKIFEKLDELNMHCRESEEKYCQKLTSLEELKKSILQKAFAGELT